MYPNLRAEMARAGVSGAEVAKMLGITAGTFSQKSNGKNEFSLDEAKTIKDMLGVDMPLDELFAKEG